MGAILDGTLVGGARRTSFPLADQSLVAEVLVEATAVFELGNGDIVVADEFFRDEPLPTQVLVILARPDGSRGRATATISRPLVNRHPYTAPGYCCSFSGLSKSDIPVGTRIELPPLAEVDSKT